MKLIVFGASGGTGKLVVQKALEQGHDVTAFVRSPEKLGITHDRLSVVPGDVKDPDAVMRSVAGHDAVLAMINTQDDLPMFESATRNILAALTAHGVRKFLYVSSFGVPDGYERDPYYEENFRQGSLKEQYAAVRRAEALIQASDVDWILVRPPLLLDTPPIGLGNVRIVDVPPLDMQMISRADLADYILMAVQDPKYIRTGMFVGN